MTYSKEIDGLRAISVILVILFHTNSAFLSGGFIGVDVFFVISGFLITSVIQNEINHTKKFRLLNFFKRRFARLLPALVLTLLATYIYGFLFYGPEELDSLGKDIFFSSLGAKNFLDANGVNYFVQEEKYKPLLHMWSLGVEEQFYLIWPLFLMLTALFLKRFVFPTTILLILIFLIISEIGVRQNATVAYFLPHYRAVELLIGSATALYLTKGFQNPRDLPLNLRSLLTACSLMTIILAAFTLDANSNFPGLNTLFVTIPAIIIITCSQGTPIGWLLSRKFIVSIGLISYPLYLYHQPLISAFLLQHEEMNRFVLFLITCIVGGSLAYGTYVFVETPIRHRAKAKAGNIQSLLLLFATVAIAAIGFWTAKSSGFPKRLAVLNPYAYFISQAVAASFHHTFNRGIYIGQSDQPKILFVGDSLLQQYVEPLSQHWGYDPSQIDIISRGGCVLLKGAAYQDKFSDISCDGLRDTVYQSNTNYDKIIISQGWNLYGGRITNVSTQKDFYGPDIWKPFLISTVNYLSPLTKKIYIIGSHPVISSQCGIEISPFTTKASIANCLKNTLIDYSSLRKSSNLFRGSLSGVSAKLLLPVDLWCDDKSESCFTQKDGVPYFRDSQHFGKNATGFLTRQMAEQDW